MVKNTMESEIQYIVEKHKTPCLVGFTSDSKICSHGSSKKGGFPDVGEDFEWPSFRGMHLSFIAQIEARHFLGENALGILQFFWNQRNWGYSVKDDGAFCVLHAEPPFTRLDAAPETEHKRFGLFTRKHSPTVWKEEALDFRDSFSLPPINRLDPFGYDWDCDRYDLYCREAESLSGFFRIGGPPFTIQTDDLEARCQRIRNIGPSDEWRLLLEVGSESDMMWGDMGRLYWFIRQNDLDKRDFTRVWMITHCH